MSTLRERILAADDRPIEPVPVPEWDCIVYLRTLSAGERERWEEQAREGGGARTRHEIRASLVVLAACDEDGRPVFTTADVPALCNKSARAVMRLFDRALKLNDFSGEDVERLEKNSATTPPADSPSGSRYASAARDGS
jgi:hypothetical protein